MRPTHFLAALLVCLVFHVGSPAQACWDGFRARVGSVSEMNADTTWSVKVVRHRALWLGRIDALLPEGASVDIEYDMVEIRARDGIHEHTWNRRSYASLFRAVATAVGADRATIRRAMATETPVYVVQAAGFAEQERAQAHADGLLDLELPHGFLEAGGFPANNPAAHVVSIEGARSVHRVYVGAYIDRAEAAAVAAELQGGAFVRTLSS